MDDWARRIGAALLVTVAVLAGGMTPAAASPREGASATTPSAGFVWPRPKAVTYAPKGEVTIGWKAGNAPSGTWRVVRSGAPVDLNGGCDAVSYRPEPAVRTSRTTLALTGQVADFCYRYAVWAPGSDAAGSPIYRSGALRTLVHWTGRYNLYRQGVFSSQAKMTWCVAASIQMMLNIVQGENDHTRASQERYITYARRNDRYLTPVAKGSDPQGWSAALRHFGGGDSYHATSNPRYKASIRAAARRLRETGKPVGLIVAHSNHAWVLTGFEASADPALVHTAQITALYIMGPLYPRAGGNGYDPAPNTRISFDRLKNFHTRYYDSRGPHNPWEGSFVTILP